jgi:NAD(P)-dependent dehydrogenase (short-subunit alcohol dehydrogenase family)
LAGRTLATLEAQRRTLAGQHGAISLDITSASSVQEAVAAAVNLHGPIMMLVNNAGTAGSKPFLAGDLEHWRTMLDVNLLGAVRFELAATRITVNAVCPGFTETDLLDETIGNIVRTTGRSAEEARSSLVRFNPQGRLIQPAEVARVVGWLCLPESAALTGQAVAVAGGEVM